MSDKPVTTRKDLEDRIILKALQDPNYKAQLLKNPKGVVQQEVHAIDASVTLPDQLVVHVHEESTDVRHIVIPRNPSDSQAPTVSGDKPAGPVPVRALRMG